MLELDINMQGKKKKKKKGSRHRIHYELKMDHRPRGKMQSYKTPGRQSRRKSTYPWYDDNFLDEIPKVLFLRTIIDKLDFIKIKSFCYTEDNVKRIRRSYRLRENICKKHI